MWIKKFFGKTEEEQTKEEQSSLILPRRSFLFMLPGIAALPQILTAEPQTLVGVDYGQLEVQYASMTLRDPKTGTFYSAQEIEMNPAHFSYLEAKDLYQLFAEELKKHDDRLWRDLDRNARRGRR